METQTETYVITDSGKRLLLVSTKPLSEQMLTRRISLWSCSVLRASLGLNMLNVLYDSWSVSVLMYMVFAS